MTNEFLEYVQRAFAKLAAERALRLHAAAYDAEAFGNAIVVLEGDDYSIRVVRDRSQVFVDLASPIDLENWHMLNRLLAVVHGDPQYEETWGGSLHLEDAAAVIDEHHDQLVARLGRKNYADTRRELERLGRLAAARLFRRT